MSETTGADVGSHMQMPVLSGGLYKAQEQMWQKGPDATSAMASREQRSCWVVTWHGK